ncbi:DUF1405 domain-containing protein [Paenibacillus koleovorans]|uniref:DUF1405 domain-containing protein n=1 Tax=Paenibacillus koleovorans TaxID=121608 RepID=UPI001FE7F9FE|nr:DUF1405 domain-containing protein [Paenibacillus koleovorans]
MSELLAWARALLFSRPMIVLLVLVNFMGTIGGYLWYGNQLVYTSEHFGAIYLPFVPDSPTASLFFTIALSLLLLPGDGPRKSFLGGLAVTFGMVTSVKYGIWAVSMIVAGWSQGDMPLWQDWMLVFTHTAMAIEALLYVGLFVLEWMQFLWVAIWLLLNDFLDYHAGIYPWLPEVLQDDLGLIEPFTFGLSLFSLYVVAVVYMRSKKGQTLIRY